ncbi:MAG: hypothetical protein M1815_006070 [Lichina confinis]|nr:MAG: hypothetical protein M1815_006070 [Lichina confinis]
MHQLVVLLALVLIRVASCLPIEKGNRPVVGPRCDSETELLEELHKLWPGERGGILDTFPPMDLDDLVTQVEEHCGGRKVQLSRHEWQVFLATALDDCYQTGSEDRKDCEARCRKRFVPRSQRADPNVLFPLGPPDRITGATPKLQPSTLKRKIEERLPKPQKKNIGPEPETDPDAQEPFSIARSTARELFNLGSAVVGQGARYMTGRTGAPQHGKSWPLHTPGRPMMFMRPLALG